MSLIKLFEVACGGELSFVEAQEINKTLACTDMEDLPSDQLGNVREYLEAPLAADSVKAEHMHPLTVLLEKLQF